jgi:hypothetical protein
VIALLLAAAVSPGFAGCRAFTTPHAALVVRPRSIVFACADANLYATGLRWSSWGVTARATGLAHANDCEPYCAAGHFHTYRVAVTLSKPKRCGGRVELTRLTWRFPAAKPAGPRAGSVDFRCA